MRFEAVTTLKQLKEIVDLVVGKNLLVALDTETSGLNKRTSELVGIGLCYDKEFSVYVPIAHKYDQPFKGADALEILRPLLEGTNKLCAYNAPFDIGFLRMAGFKIPWERVEDVMIMASIYAKYKIMKLSAVAKQELGLEVWDFSAFMPQVGLTSKKSIAEAKVSEVAEYCGRDAYATFCLYERLYPKVYDQFIYKLENSLMSCVDWMVSNGVLVDKEFFGKEAERLSEKLKDLGLIIKKMAQDASGNTELDFNIGSNQQVGNILFDVLKLESTKATKKGARSTDEEALLDLKYAHPIVNNILAYRGIAKRVSSYLEDYCGDYVQEDGRIHASFNQVGAGTGRFSCSDPNLQNIPNSEAWWIKKTDGTEEEVLSNIRTGFVVPVDHYFVEFDYSQIEARLAAGVTQEYQLLNAFRDGIDFHTKTGSLVFKVPVSQVTKHQRRIGKTTNFSLIYGGGGKTLYSRLKKDMKTTLDECKVYAKAYREGYAKMFMVADEISDEAQRVGYITTLFGRKMTLFDFVEAEKYTGSDYESRKKKEQAIARGRRQGYNGVIQGTAADVIKLAMRKVYKKFGELNWLEVVRLLMQIHDALIFQVPKTHLLEVLRLVPQLMLFKHEGFPDVPVSVKVGTTWGKLIEKDDKESVEDFYSRITGDEVVKVAQEEKKFILEFKEGMLKEAKQLEEFKSLVKNSPGGNEIVVRVNDVDKVMKNKTSIGMELKEKIMMLTGGVFYEKLG